MANMEKAPEKPVEKTVPTIELGGRVWFLEVNHRVFERFSAISQCTMENFDAVLMRYDMMVLLLWLMMCETRQDLTRNGLTGWLNEFPVRDAVDLVSNAVAEAMAYSFPEPAEAPAAGPDEAESGNPTAADI